MRRYLLILMMDYGRYVDDGLSSDAWVVLVGVN